jgi:hypothetical protein
MSARTSWKAVTCVNHLYAVCKHCVDKHNQWHTEHDGSRDLGKDKQDTKMEDCNSRAQKRPGLNRCCMCTRSPPVINTVDPVNSTISGNDDKNNNNTESAPIFDEVGIFDEVDIVGDDDSNNYDTQPVNNNIIDVDIPDEFIKKNIFDNDAILNGNGYTADQQAEERESLIGLNLEAD